MPANEKPSSPKGDASEVGPSMSGDAGDDFAMNSGETWHMNEPSRCQSPTFRRIIGEVSATDPDQMLSILATESERDEEDAVKVLSLAERLYELQDGLAAAIVDGRNLRNEVLTLQDENLQLQLSLNRERKKVEKIWNQLDEGARPRDMSPPRPPLRSYQQNRGRTQQPAPPRLVPFRLGETPVSRSCTLCSCLMPWNLNESDILDIEDMLEDELSPYLAHRYVTPVDSFFQRYQAVSSSVLHGGRNSRAQGSCGTTHAARLLRLIQARRQQIAQHEMRLEIQQQPRQQRQQQQQQLPQRSQRENQPASGRRRCCVCQRLEGSISPDTRAPTRPGQVGGAASASAVAGNRRERLMFTLSNRPLDYEQLPLD